MKDEPDVVFTTSLAVRGFSNGIVNLAFNQAQFLPEEIDLFCAQQVYEALGKILADQTKPTAKGDLN